MYMDIPASYIETFFSNFGLFMFSLAALIILVHKLIVGDRVPNDEIVYRWLALFPLGATGIYTFVIHAFYPEVADVTIGWTASPFEFEVAIADLAFGTMAIFSFNASLGFRLATILGNVIWLFGDASQHIMLMILDGNYNIGNAGSWLWLDDLILPLVMVLCLNSIYQRANP